MNTEYVKLLKIFFAIYGLLYETNEIRIWYNFRITQDMLKVIFTKVFIYYTYVLNFNRNYL